MEIFVERNNLKNVSVYTPNYKVNDFFGLKYPTIDFSKFKLQIIPTRGF